MKLSLCLLLLSSLKSKTQVICFDCLCDQFLEEARNDQASTHSNSFEKAKMEDGKKKKKHKSWRRSLSFWVRLQRNGRYEAAPKAKSLMDTIGSGEGNRRFSGPLFGNGSRLAHLHHKLRHSASGPLSSCFTPTRAEESELPYRCIGHQRHPLDPQAFGPIYLVT